ncbi:MAG: hypothetical protein QNJ40_23780 [Xanthomonadales bacterium]|nr:hypothetical protein [Xanthomonadales bacterium]
MKWLIWVLLPVLSFAGTDGPSGGDDVRDLATEARQAELDRLYDRYIEAVFSPEFRDLLEPRTDWRSQLTRALLLRYPDEPGGGSPSDPGAIEFETVMAGVIDSAPTALAPRALMLTHCHEAQTVDPDECHRRHSDALLQHHPGNAAGYLYKAAWYLARENVSEAAEWMVMASEQPRVDLGLWALVQVLFESFAAAPVDDHDPTDQMEVARLHAAEVTLAHLHTAPHHVLNYPCQQARAEPLLSGCLAAAGALKRPGTMVLAHRIALAMEENVYRQRGDEAGLRQVKLERSSLPISDRSWRDAMALMNRQGDVAKVLDAWVRFGELDTRIKTASRHAEPADAAAQRLGCLKGTFGPDAPDCVTADMVEAEVERQSERMHRGLNESNFRDALARDASAEAQLLLKMLQRQDQSSAGSQPPPTPGDLVASHPASPVINRVAAEWCGEDWHCLLETSERIQRAEPDEATGYLLAAAAYFELGQPAQAEQALHRAASARSNRSGFALLTTTMRQVLLRHLPAPANDDPLDVWPVAAWANALGTGAALSLPAVRAMSYCREAQKKALQTACLDGTQAMLAPGSSMVEHIVALTTRAMLFEATGDSQGYEATIERLAAAEKLRDAMLDDLRRILRDPELNAQYAERLAGDGEVAALRWLRLAGR